MQLVSKEKLFFGHKELNSFSIFSEASHLDVHTYHSSDKQ